MRSEIDGKVYDTATAVRIRKAEFPDFTQTLYRTAEGEFFVALEIDGGGSIAVVSRERAQKILDRMKALG